MPYIDVEKRKKYQRGYYKAHYSNKALDRRQEKKVLFQARLPESVLARMRKMVDEAIAAGRYPWKSMASLTLQLIIRGFDSFEGDEFVDEMLPYLHAMQAIDQLRVYRGEAQAALGRLKTEVSELIAIKQESVACTHYHAMLDEFRKMPPNVWSDWLVRETKRAFPKLLHMKPSTLKLVHPKSEKHTHTKHAHARHAHTHDRR